MLLTDVLLIIIFSFYYYKEKEFSRGLALVIIVAFFSTLLVITAPGNVIRKEFYPNNINFLNSIIKSSLQTVYSFMLWYGLVSISALLIVKEIFIEKKDKISGLGQNLDFFFLVLIAIGITCFGFFIGFWVTGEALAPRVRNVVYLFFILGCLYFSIILLSRIDILNINFIQNKNLHLCIILLFTLLIFSKKNINNCFVDLMKNKAYKYNIELKERKRLTKKVNNNGDLVLPPIKNFPKTLFLFDMKTYDNHFYNQCYSHYWNLSSVIIKCGD